MAFLSPLMTRTRSAASAARCCVSTRASPRTRWRSCRCRKKTPSPPSPERSCTACSASFVCEYDETQSIGRRYRRQDEIGTPLCVTVDFDSLEDKQVTVRERDSTDQTRLPIEDLLGYLRARLEL